MPSGVLGHVVSAAYSYVDNRLWVIDEVERGARNVGSWCSRGRPETRLLRIERQTGAIRVIASSERRGTFDERQLLIDQDGQVLLFGSSSTRNVHGVARLVPDANGFAVSSALNLAGAVIGGATVDSEGYSFVERAPRGSPRPFALERVKSLPFQASSMDAWTKLLE